MKSRRVRWAGHEAFMWEKRNACRILMGKLEGKGLLWKHRRRCEDNIKLDLKEIRWGLVQNRDRWNVL
jgi:hypothetical protein